MQHVGNLPGIRGRGRILPRIRLGLRLLAQHVIRMKNPQGVAAALHGMHFTNDETRHAKEDRGEKEDQ